MRRELSHLTSCWADPILSLTLVNGPLCQLCRAFQCIAVHFGVPVSKARLSGSLCHSSRGGGGATGVVLPRDDDLDGGVDDDDDYYDCDPRGWGGHRGRRSSSSSS